MSRLCEVQVLRGYQAAGADDLLRLTKNHAFENQSLLWSEEHIASGRMPTGLATTSKGMPDLAAY